MPRTRPTIRPNIRLSATSGLGVGIVVLAIFAMFVSSGNFLTRSTMSTLTPLLAVAAIIAVGQAMVIGTGGIDLSVPYTMTLVGSIVLYVCRGDAGKVPLAAAVALVVCVVIGTVNGLLVEVFGLNSLVATLAVGQVVAGITRLYRGPVDTVTSVPEQMQNWARENAAGLSVLIVIAVAIVAVLTFTVHRTVRGRELVASAASPRTAFLIGLYSTSYRVAAYATAAVLYGIGSLTLAGLLGSPDLTFGDAYELSPIVAVVLGGAILTGGRISFVNTALGAVFVTLLDYGLRVAGYSAGVSMLVQGLVLALGLSAIYVVKQRAARPSTISGPQAGLDAPQVIGAHEG